jgi:hypothetical protein
VRKQQTFTHNSRNSGLTFVQCYFCQVKNYLILSIEIFTQRAFVLPLLLTGCRADYGRQGDRREAERRPDGKGGYSTTLPPAMLDPIKEPARPGETAT